MELRAVFELIVCMLFPVLLTMVLVYAEKDRGYKSSAVFKIFAGIIFGMAAVFSTEIGILSVGGSVINLRDASVICAGAFFGLPGGIVAGLIGGAERLFAAYIWHSAGEYTAVACALTTLLAGTVAGFFGSYRFAHKKPGIIFGLIIGVLTEIVHCALVALLHPDDFSQAWSIIEANGLPLIISNTLSIVAAVIAVKWIYKNRKK